MTTPSKVDGVNLTPDDNVRTVIMYATAAVTAKNAVALHYGGTAPSGYGPQSIVRQAVSTNQDGKGALCGIALETITVAGPLLVQVKGRCTDVNVHADTVAGDRMVASSTAGRLSPHSTVAAVAAADFDYGVLGIAEEADTANAADVFLLDPMGLA